MLRHRAPDASKIREVSDDNFHGSEGGDEEEQEDDEQHSGEDSCGERAATQSAAKRHCRR